MEKIAELPWKISEFYQKTEFCVNLRKFWTKHTKNKPVKGVFSLACLHEEHYISIEVIYRKKANSMYNALWDGYHWPLLWSRVATIMVMTGHYGRGWPLETADGIL